MSLSKKLKEIIAITCSWCKQSYHNKLGCFSASCLEEKCDRGALRNMIYRPFIVRPLDSSLPGPSQPLLVFVNPKSGGNKGSKALHTFCWLLNPRQVGDIQESSQATAHLNWPVYPPMAVLPLGTGNDLSRCMGWGGSFTDEPLSHLLSAVLYETSITHLDRWQIDVQPCLSNQMETGEELSEAAPIRRCSTVDLKTGSPTEFHCILFQNITYYAGGTIPWGSDDDENTKPSSCDGKIEVLGFTTATLAALQMGGKGERIAQCSHVNISTSKAIPMQVDGEPCLLAPSVPMLRREKKLLNMPTAARRAIKPMKSLTNIQVAIPSDLT
uniref:Diacylglycerol kinase n=1 Tax=Parascaris equorum TaxID=6256 RepID=A0A914RK17_PAREQ